MFSFRKSMLATNNFSKSVQNADQNFIDQNFHLIGLESIKIPCDFTLHVTSSKDMLVTCVPLWEIVFQKNANVSKMLRKMTFFCQ